MHRTVRRLPAGQKSFAAQHPGHLTNGRPQRRQSVMQSPNLLLTIAGRAADGSKLERPDIRSIRGMYDGCPSIASATAPVRCTAAHAASSLPEHVTTVAIGLSGNDRPTGTARPYSPAPHCPQSRPAQTPSQRCFQSPRASSRPPRNTHTQSPGYVARRFSSTYSARIASNSSSHAVNASTITGSK